MNTAMLLCLLPLSVAHAQDDDDDFFDNLGQEAAEAEPLPGSEGPTEAKRLLDLARNSAATVRTETGGSCIGGGSGPFKRTAMSAANMAPAAASLVESLEALKAGIQTLELGDDGDRRALEMELDRAIPDAKKLHVLTQAMVAVDKSDARPGKGAPDTVPGTIEAIAKEQCGDEPKVCVPAKNALQQKFCNVAGNISPLSR